MGQDNDKKKDSADENAGSSPTRSDSNPNGETEGQLNERVSDTAAETDNTGTSNNVLSEGQHTQNGETNQSHSQRQPQDNHKRKLDFSSCISNVGASTSTAERSNRFTATTGSILGAFGQTSSISVSDLQQGAGITNDQKGNNTGRSSSLESCARVRPWDQEARKQHRKRNVSIPHRTDPEGFVEPTPSDIPIESDTRPVLNDSQTDTDDTDASASSSNPQNLTKNSRLTGLVTKLGQRLQPAEPDSEASAADGEGHLGGQDSALNQNQLCGPDDASTSSEQLNEPNEDSDDYIDIVTIDEDSLQILETLKDLNDSKDEYWGDKKKQNGDEFEENEKYDDEDQEYEDQDYEKYDDDDEDQEYEDQDYEDQYYEDQEYDDQEYQDDDEDQEYDDQEYEDQEYEVQEYEDQGDHNQEKEHVVLVGVVNADSEGDIEGEDLEEEEVVEEQRVQSDEELRGDDLEQMQIEYPENEVLLEDQPLEDILKDL